jgi:thiamine biosynthesis lipoprotein
MHTDTAPFQKASFQAMGSPGEILLDTSDAGLVAQALDTAREESARIEDKYSRYRKGNVIDRINSSGGKRIELDEETAALMDYAAHCYEISSGLFDITTGILRTIWRFEGETLIPPSEREVAEVSRRIGWNKLTWERPFLTLPEGFEIDLGGICKEYAADRILQKWMRPGAAAALVNLGGDIAVAGQRQWSVGIENPMQPGEISRTVFLRQGGVATSGTTKRFANVKGEKLGHILNPKTGMPVQAAPLSVTVAAKTCTEAGFWSTLAILHGSGAEAFLKEQNLEFQCFR